MKKSFILFFIILKLTSQRHKNLNSVFGNCLILDIESNISRLNLIKITEIDKQNNRIKTNYIDFKTC